MRCDPCKTFFAPPTRTWSHGMWQEQDEGRSSHFRNDVEWNVTEWSNLADRESFFRTFIAAVERLYASEWSYVLEPWRPHGNREVPTTPKLYNIMTIVKKNEKETNHSDEMYRTPKQTKTRPTKTRKYTKQNRFQINQISRLLCVFDSIPYGSRLSYMYTYV